MVRRTSLSLAQATPRPLCPADAITTPAAKAQRQSMSHCDAAELVAGIDLRLSMLSHLLDHEGMPDKYELLLIVGQTRRDLQATGNLLDSGRAFTMDRLALAVASGD